jgi:hypothetical protein
MNMTFLDGMRELIAHAATHPTVSPLETLFDVVARMPLDAESKGVLDALLYDTIRKHPAY